MASPAVLKLLRMGHPLLRKQAVPFKPDEITSSSTKTLIKDMKRALHHYSGVGLAAPQIGISKQLLLIEIPEGTPNVTPVPLTAIFNPRLEFLLKHETILMWESCLSVPSLVGKVPRYNNVIVHYLVRRKVEFKDSTFTNVTFAPCIVSERLTLLDFCVVSFLFYLRMRLRSQ